MCVCCGTVEVGVAVVAVSVGASLYDRLKEKLTRRKRIERRLDALCGRERKERNA